MIRSLIALYGSKTFGWEKKVAIRLAPTATVARPTGRSAPTPLWTRYPNGR